MRSIRFFAHWVLLFTIPNMMLHPLSHFPHIATENQYQEEWICPTTYDDILQLLDDLESGELERRYSPMQLERVNNYIATLAQEGILPNEFEEERELEEDTYDLMYGEDSAFQLTCYLENSHESTIIPAVLSGHSSYDIIQCGKIGKAWKKTKKFCKKHKQAIIIGAVVVVTATVIVVAASTAGAASAAAGAAGAAACDDAKSSDSDHSESKKSESTQESPPVSAAPKETLPPVDTNNAPVIKAAIDEHVASFKERLVEDKAAQQETGSKGCDEKSFRERAREAGAGIAHEAFDAITDTAKPLPQLCEEIKELIDRFFPECAKWPNFSNSASSGSPMENYEDSVATGHKVIDTVFSTDQAKFFTPEAKANAPRGILTIAVLPPPGSFTKTFSNVGKFKQAGKVLDKAGFTKSGRGLMKHGNRKGSVFPKPLGNPSEMNRRGQKILEEILDHPDNQVYRLKNGGMKVYSPDRRGVIFEKNGNFRGFVEKQYEKDIFN